MPPTICAKRPMHRNGAFSPRRQTLAEHIMQLTYIYHSGFAVETSQCVLLFDCWRDPEHAADALLDTEKPVYVFASHFHEDHFTNAIFTWRKRKNNLTYILSKDILRHRRAAKTDADVWMAKGSTWADAHVKVWAAGSNDSGVSWIVETDGKRIFHAGDLGNWYARFLTDDYNGGEIYSPEFGEWCNPRQEEKRYLGELKDIGKIMAQPELKRPGRQFDIAFIPVDGRIGNGYTRGARQFIERFDVGLFVPMHFTISGFQSAWRMEEFTKAQGIDFWAIARNGETFTYHRTAAAVATRAIS